MVFSGKNRIAIVATSLIIGLLPTQSVSASIVPYDFNSSEPYPTRKQTQCYREFPSDRPDLRQKYHKEIQQCLNREQQQYLQEIKRWEQRQNNPASCHPLISGCEFPSSTGQTSTNGNTTSSGDVFDIFIPSKEEVGGVLGQFQSLANKALKDILKGNIGGAFNWILNTVKNTFTSYISKLFTQGQEWVLGQVSGVLGLPDSNLLKEVFGKVLKGDLQGIFDLGIEQVVDLVVPANNSPILADKMAVDSTIALAEAVADSTALSLDAQEQNLVKLQMVQELVNSSVELGNNSQSQDISQNILKNISDQMATEQTLKGVLVAEVNSSRLDRAISNKVLARILKETQKNNQRKIRENASMGRLLINQPTYVMPGILARQR